MIYKKYIYHCNFNLLENNIRIDIKALEKGLAEPFVGTIINIDPVGCL